MRYRNKTLQTISRDIHDNINLSLTLAKLNLNTLDITNKEKSMEQLTYSIDIISKSIIDLTDISRSMNSDIISEQGLIKALELEIEKLKKLNRFLYNLNYRAILYIWMRRRNYLFSGLSRNLLIIFLSMRRQKAFSCICTIIMNTLI
ncbi:MAG: hypothetical protein WDO16_21820 [Bacteroidota bacterium]